MVQIVRLGKTDLMLMDENGKFRLGNFINYNATQIYQNVIDTDDEIVGNVLICHESQFL